MKLDAGMLTHDLRTSPEFARKVEAMGYDCLWSSETQHDPYLPLAVAATQTSGIKLGTNIATVFSRSPMITAHIAWDLQKASGGRFTLGLGTQVKGHNERRFSVKWESPGPKMAEAIRAIRAIWDCWQHSTRLDFRSRHYTHTLMTPFFNPGPIEHPDIPIFLGGVNPYMCRIAGEVADGLLMHSLNSATYIRSIVLPAVLEGLQKSTRPRSAFTLRGTVFPVLGDTEEELDLARAAVRQRIAFYASTRTYKTVLEAHGWGDLTDRLHAMAGRGAWEAMGREITDDMLDAFCIISTPAMLGQKLRERFEGLVDRLFLNLTYEPAAKKIDWPRLIQELAA